jgi:ribokinase
MTAAAAWDVVVIGGLNTDFLVRGHVLPRSGASLDGDVFFSGPGGKGGNAAVAAARFGARTAIVGRVGGDERGRALIAALLDEGVHAARVGIDQSTPSGAAVVQVDHTGRKQILAALGANLRLRVEDVEAAGDAIRSSRVLLMQLEVPVECVAAAARLARSAGLQVLLDPAPPRSLTEDLLALCNVVRGNAGEIEALTRVHVRDRATARDAAHALIARGVGAVVVSAGDGNLLVQRDEEQWLPEIPVKAVDATGAGDAFSGTLAAALADGRSLVEASRLASGAAALATTALGAQTALPRRRTLEAFVDQAFAHAPVDGRKGS